jgi:hypothetical protein
MNKNKRIDYKQRTKPQMGKDHGDGSWGGPVYDLFNFPEYDNFP